MDYITQKKLAQEIGRLIKKGYNSKKAQDIVFTEYRTKQARLIELARAEK